MSSRTTAGGRFHRHVAGLAGWERCLIIGKLKRPRTRSPMTIEFHCPGCGGLMRTPDETSGKKGRCPNCGIKVRIPATSLAVSSAELLVVEPTPEPRKIEFYCSNCGNQVRVAEAAAGQRGKCPKCAAVVQIPDPRLGA